MLTLPVMLSHGGPVLWLLLIISAVAVAVFIERFLHCHRAQINSTEFLNGIRTVLKRNNLVEALSICDATPGPIARLVKIAIVNRDQGRERVREALEEAGSAEVPRLERKLVSPPILASFPAGSGRRWSARRRAWRCPSPRMPPTTTW